MIGRCLILLLISYESLAQTYVGPNHQAMGFTGVALQGIYSLTANPAGLVGMERPTVSLNYQYHFLSTDITTQSALAALPTRLGVFGITALRYGLKGAYDEGKLGFTFARSLGPQFAMGMSLAYHQLYVPNYLSVSSLSVDLGVQYRLEQGMVIGFQYTNIGRADYGQDLYGTIPTAIRLGASCPLSTVLVSADVSYGFAYRLNGHVGIEYNVGERLYLRGGLSANPLQQHVGFGIHWDHFRFDVATTFHPRLGTSPQIGLSYEL